MFSGAYPRNAWYVAGPAEEFGRALSARRLLGDEILFFRKADGTAVALEDACPHRKLPLSLGTLSGDTVVCGYHGLTFDACGACVASPTQPGEMPSVHVHRYPVTERYGFVWVWPGDPAQADPAALIDIPDYDNPGWGRTQSGALDIACNYLWITDNLLDPSHFAWVHVGSFAGVGGESVPMTIREGADGVTVWRWIRDRPPPPFYRSLLPFSGNCDRKQHYECRLPAVAINRSVYTPAGTGGDGVELPESAFINSAYHFMTPVDRDSTRYFWFQHRNCFPHDQVMSDLMFAGATMAFNEDKRVLEAVQRGMRATRTSWIDLGSDEGALRFRSLVKQRVAEEAVGQDTRGQDTRGQGKRGQS